MLWFHAAIVVHIVQSRAEEKDPGDGDHAVPETVVAPHAGGSADEQNAVAPQCGSRWCKQQHIRLARVIKGKLMVGAILVVSPNVYGLMWPPRVIQEGQRCKVAGCVMKWLGRALCMWSCDHFCANLRRDGSCHYHRNRLVAC